MREGAKGVRGKRSIAVPSSNNNTVILGLTRLFCIGRLVFFGEKPDIATALTSGEDHTASLAIVITTAGTRPQQTGVAGHILMKPSVKTVGETGTCTGNGSAYGYAELKRETPPKNEVQGTVLPYFIVRA